MATAEAANGVMATASVLTANAVRGDKGERVRQQTLRNSGRRCLRRSTDRRASSGQVSGAPKGAQSTIPENYPTFPAPVIEDKIRLNRCIAMSGICSRREADEFIQSGVVSVNGLVVTELGPRCRSRMRCVSYGNVIRNERKVYIVMNKPKGYVTSVEDPHADKTVMELLKEGCRERVYPVGRLDKNSLGVLLITSDGDMAKKLMHPSSRRKGISSRWTNR